MERQVQKDSEKDWKRKCEVLSRLSAETLSETLEYF